MAKQLFGFPRELAGPLVDVARDRLHNPQGTEESIARGTTSRRNSYMVEPVGSIPAATIGAEVTAGLGSGYILEVDTDSTSLTYLEVSRIKDHTGTDFDPVPVYNSTDTVITGSFTSPVYCIADVNGVLWASSSAAGSSNIYMAETKTTLSAGTITAGVLTAGSGLAYLLYRDVSGELLRAQDGIPADIEITVYNTALQKILKDEGRVLQVNQDAFGTYWSVPPDYGPSIMFENLSAGVPIAGAAYDSGTDTLTPVLAGVYLLGYGVISGDVERRQDSGSADVVMTVRNPLMEDVLATKGQPRYAVRDPDGVYWVRSEGRDLVYFDTYLAALPAASTVTPGQATQRTYSFNGTIFTQDGPNTVIFNLGEEIATGDTTVRLAVVNAAGEAFAVTGWQPDPANCEELAGKTPADLDEIVDATDTVWILGVDDLGCYVKIPVASCPAQLEHS